MHTERFKGEPRRFGRDAACNVSISRRRFLNPGILMNRQGFLPILLPPIPILYPYM
jgi:hypothetical protein